MRRSSWVILVLTCVCLLAPGLALAQPRLVIDNKDVVIDQPVASGQLVASAYQISNTGDQDLVIEQVAPGCGCTIPTFDRTIPPGGQGQILLTLDTSGFEGEIKKSAVVQTNDPERSRFMITIKTTVTP